MNQTNATPSRMSALRALSITGLATLLNTALAILRAKITAVTVGPHGVGLMGTLTAYHGSFATIASLGLQAAAVREIARLEGTGQAKRSARLAKAVEKILLVTGCIGTACMILLSYPLAASFLNDTTLWYDLTVSSFAVLFANLYSAKMALLQSRRRVGAIAKIGVFSSAISTAAFVPILVYGGIRGIAYALVVVFFTQYVSAAYQTRSISSNSIRINWRRTRALTRGLGRASFPFLVTGLITSTAKVATASGLAKLGGLEETGQFIAALTLSTMAAAFLMNAMESDLYPRIAMTPGDTAYHSRTVNEQIEVTLLVCTPIAAGVTLFSSHITSLLYSTDFQETPVALSILIVSSVVRLVSWPLALHSLATNHGKLYFTIESMLSIGLALSALFGYSLMGVAGASFAHLVTTIVYTVFLILYYHSTKRIDLSPHTYRLILFSTILNSGCLIAALTQNLVESPVPAAAAVGIIVLASLLQLSKIRRRQN